MVGRGISSRMSTNTSGNGAAALPLNVDAEMVATVTLEPNQGAMCILDEGLIRRIDVTLRGLKGRSDLRGLILASGSPRVFVAGADLKSIVAMSHAELEAYLAFGQRVFGLLCDLPMPTVAAINGAVLGGGLELAMHCDGLVALRGQVVPGKDGGAAVVKGYPIGLPEAGLKICPGWGGTNLLPARLKDPAEGIARTCSGQTWMIDQVETTGGAGLVDEFVPAEGGQAELLKAAKGWLLRNATVHAKRRDGKPLKWIGRSEVINTCAKAAMDVAQRLGAEAAVDPSRAVLKAVRAGLDGGSERGWGASLQVEREELNRLRGTPEGKGAIEAFFAKSAGGGKK